MAEGLLRHLAGDAVEAHSAGAKPSHVNRFAIQAMNARGIDIRGQSSERIDKYLERPFDYVITVCDKAAESCPVFPGPARRSHWSFPDPAGVAGDDETVLASFVHVREGLEAKLKDWLNTLS